LVSVATAARGKERKELIQSYRGAGRILHRTSSTIIMSEATEKKEAEANVPFPSYNIALAELPPPLLCRPPLFNNCIEILPTPPKAKCACAKTSCHRRWGRRNICCFTSSYLSQSPRRTSTAASTTKEKGKIISIHQLPLPGQEKKMLYALLLKISGRKGCSLSIMQENTCCALRLDLTSQLVD
jgi:hypothetical protein